MKRLSWYIKVFGLQGLLLAFCAVFFKRSIKVKFYSQKLNAWLTLRTKTSDLAVYEKVVFNEEYRLPDGLTPKTIIDAGANIGLSALYYSNQYPDALVVAIEPEESNFELLVDNVGTCKNIRSIKGAIWNKSEPIKLSGHELSFCGFQVESNDSEDSVFGMTMDELMLNCDLKHIDILKMDIEGAEKEVFEASSSWIQKVGFIVIELHERMKPGCVQVVEDATSGFEDTWVSGENNFYSRRGWF